MKICLAQSDIIWEDKEKNMEKCAEFIRKAKDSGPKMIIFPEMSLTGFSMNVEKTGEEKGESVEFFKRRAIENDIYICFGYVKKIGSDFFNRAVVIDKVGGVVCEYDKIHPFSYGEESKYFKGGEKTVEFMIDNDIFSCFVCYDLRFPEIFQVVSKRAKGIIVIANWPKNRIEHWDCLLKARAIENQCFIIGVNRTGGEYNGHSAVYSPYGERLNEIEEDEKLIFCDIDLNECEKYRNEFPLKKDRREEIYFESEVRNIERTDR